MSDYIRLLRDAMRNILGELTVRTMQEGSKQHPGHSVPASSIFSSVTSHTTWSGMVSRRRGLKGKRGETEGQHSTLRTFWLSITKF